MSNGRQITRARPQQMAAPAQQGWVWDGSSWVCDADDFPCQPVPCPPVPPPQFPPWFDPHNAPWYPGANAGVQFRLDHVPAVSDQRKFFLGWAQAVDVRRRRLGVDRR